MVLLAWGLAGPALLACDTPVYRYAMYNWAPAPYRVYHLCQGEPDKKDAEVNRLLAEQATALPAAANVVVELVDAGKKEELEMLPEPVKKAWEKEAGSRLPVHLVFTSWGDLIWHDRLDAAAVKALVDSPVRAQIAGLLEKRHAAVFLLFEGKDAAANALAEKTAREVIARAAKGRLGVEPAENEPAAPGNPGPSGAAPASESPTAAEDTAPARPKPLRIGLVKLRRDDAAEKWLVRSLATVEREIPEAAGLPMVFPVFGRGRVLAPCIGTGITLENLLGQLELLTGPCSCTVRAQNPGVDLLFRRDWDAVAEAMAAEERALADQEPTEAPVAEAASGLSGAGASDATSGAAVSASAGPASAPLVGASESSPLPEAPVDSLEEESGSFTMGQVWKFALGFAVVAAGVMALGLVLVRNRGDDSP